MTEESSLPKPTAAEDYPPVLLEVESLDIDAQGIAHRADRKVVFIEGAPAWMLNLIYSKYLIATIVLIQLLIGRPTEARAQPRG